MPKPSKRGVKRQRHLNEYSTSVQVDTKYVPDENALPGTFNPLQYEVERFSTWYYIRYAKVYLSKPEVEVVPISTGTAFKLTFRWVRWEM